MIDNPRPIQSDPFTEPKVTAIYRKVDGESQIVLVCEGCEKIHTITVEEAMRVALGQWMGHHAQRHQAWPSDQHSEGEK